MADRSGALADRAGGGEPHLAALLRDRSGADLGRARHARRASLSSGAARLAGGGADREPLGSATHHRTDRDVANLSPVFGGARGCGGDRSGEPPPVERTEASFGGGGD